MRTRRCRRKRGICFTGLASLSLIVLLSGLPGVGQVLTQQQRALLADRPGLRRVLESKRDAWGQAALLQPNGPSYESFEQLLPPLRYVNAAFRHHPVVLSAPTSTCKARLVSNGSAVNARSGHERWKDPGFPVTFSIGGEVFGADLARLDGPRYVEGWLPVVQMSYSVGGAVCEQESFAAVEQTLAKAGAVFVRFRLQKGMRADVSAEIGLIGLVEAGAGVLRGERGVLVQFDRAWRWDGQGHRLTAALRPGSTASLAVFTEPHTGPPRFDYAGERDRCLRVWRALVGHGMQVETPERVVNDAWRADGGHLLAHQRATDILQCG